MTVGQVAQKISIWVYLSVVLNGEHVFNGDPAELPQELEDIDVESISIDGNALVLEC